LPEPLAPSQKRAALVRGVLQPLDRSGNVAAAAEEDRRVCDDAQQVIALFVSHGLVLR
jgi:hypothetical protein